MEAGPPTGLVAAEDAVDVDDFSLLGSIKTMIKFLTLSHFSSSDN
jgi:hypothetical protein